MYSSAGISIHAPRTGSDIAQMAYSSSTAHFNPRSPHGERLQQIANLTGIVQFQSTLPARGATLLEKIVRESICISIHAPRTGSDCQLLADYDRPSISIHAPRTGSDRIDCYWAIQKWLISIHAPRTGSDSDAAEGDSAKRISIHAPRTGSDFEGMRIPGDQWDFNPRSPHGERQPLPATHQQYLAISIHAPRTGSDHPLPRQNRAISISIHAPRTGSDTGAGRRLGGHGISIHAPRTGSDCFRLLPTAHGAIFQSTLPARGAT